MQTANVDQRFGVRSCEMHEDGSMESQVIMNVVMYSFVQIGPTVYLCTLKMLVILYSLIS